MIKDKTTYDLRKLIRKWERTCEDDPNGTRSKAARDVNEQIWSKIENLQESKLFAENNDFADLVDAAADIYQQFPGVALTILAVADRV